jgi:3'-phosphoadenosine 5'-phosphosulfate sulfotransferase (PAPS reductase)/FAD synthetase
MSVLFDTAREVRARAAEHDAVLVAFSGGKDSLAVLDLCLRAFKRVECFHFEFIAGLDVTRLRVADPLARLGVPCRYYADPKALDAYKRGVFCDPAADRDFLRVPTASEAYAAAAADAGIPLVATGKKESDFPRRGINIRHGREPGWHPIRKWHKADVVGHLAARGIPLPDAHRDAGGIDLTAGSLRWLRATHPADFARLLKWFPYAHTAIIRLEQEEARREEARREEEAARRSAAGTGSPAGTEADPVRRVRGRRRAAGPDPERPVQPAADHPGGEAAAEEEP